MIILHDLSGPCRNKIRQQFAAAAGGNDKTLDSSGIQLEFRVLRVGTPALRV